MLQKLQCRECKTSYEPNIAYFCEECFGPLEAIYDFASINLTRNEINSRSKNMWRYKELLPLQPQSKIIDLGTGYTTLHKCDNLGKYLGIKELYIKDDTGNPSASFKDRPASVAVSKAIENKAKAVGCVSTGNLAAATAAHAAKAGIPCYIFIPFSIELSKVAQISAYNPQIIKVNGTYDDANRLAAEASFALEWAIVNVNLRPYYVEGSKTLSFEICEQLNWDTPDQVIIPMASGALLCATDRGFNQFNKIGLVNKSKIKISGAQATGCSPIADAFKNKLDDVIPVREPKTIAKSLAIGDPADGPDALKVINNSGGYAESVTDTEIKNAISLLAKTEGIFTEPAGAVTIASLIKLVKAGKIEKDEKIVCFVTGNGLKSPESVKEEINTIQIAPNLDLLTKKLNKKEEVLNWQQ